jgi:hypothetical protein
MTAALRAIPAAPSLAVPQAADASLTPDAAAIRRLTIFRDLAARSAEVWSGSLSDLAARFRATTAPHKRGLSLVSGCRFGDAPSKGGSLRHSANITALLAVVVEHDGGLVTLAEAVDRFRRAGVAAFIYATPSSTPDKPRWRAIMPLAAEHALSMHQALVDKVDRLLGGGVLARESWTAAQSFYFGRVEGGPNASALVPGVPLDLAHDEAGKASEGDGAAVAGDADWTGDVDARPALPPPSLPRIRSALAFLDPEPRGVWLRVGAALKAHAADTGDDVVSVFLEWSRGDLRHDGARVPATYRGEEDCLRLLATLRRDGDAA